MSQRLPNVKVGDLIRVFTYNGTTLVGHAKIPYIVDECRFGDEIFEPLTDEDGLRFVGVYLGSEEARHAMRHSQKEREPYVKMQALCQNREEKPWNWGTPNSNDPDLVIPERLIRRYQVLEPVYSSPALTLEKPSHLEALTS